MSDSQRYLSIGTNSSPYFIPSSENPAVTKTDQGYFYLQIYSAQAAFAGPWWIGAQNLAITSQINLHLDDNAELANEDVRSILQYRKLEKDNAVQLGFSPILIDFIPARMKKVSVSIEYLVDTKNYLKDMVGIITDKTLLSTISFTPGAAMVAKTLSGLTQKIVASFFPADERKPILQFSGEFDLAVEGLKEGYYVIFGSHSSKNPLPEGKLSLEVGPGGILKNNGEVITHLSYVIFKVGCVTAIRDRIVGNSPWRIKLREIKRQVQDFTDDPFSDKEGDARKKFWQETCLPALKEVQTLLKTDPNFLEEEVELVYRASYRECLDLITGKETVRKGVAMGQVKHQWSPDHKSDKKFLGIPSKEDMDTALADYSNRLYKARQVFNQIST